MNTLAPSSLDSADLACRLRDLAGDERNVQVDFLIHLDEFDRRRAYLEAGYGSLWDYCLRALHLREGAAGRRIAAMRVLRRFPRIEPALRDGRLCSSTLALLGHVLTEENADELVARAAYKTKAEVDHLVASIRPRAAPREGVRKLPDPREAERTAVAPRSRRRSMRRTRRPRPSRRRLPCRSRSPFSLPRPSTPRRAGRSRPSERRRRYAPSRRTAGRSGSRSTAPTRRSSRP
jgi:hypothetical protein